MAKNTGFAGVLSAFKAIGDTGSKGGSGLTGVVNAIKGGPAKKKKPRGKTGQGIFGVASAFNKKAKSNIFKATSGAGKKSSSLLG